jgi:hypothetical protein
MTWVDSRCCTEVLSVLGEGCVAKTAARFLRSEPIARARSHHVRGVTPEVYTLCIYIVDISFPFEACERSSSLQVKIWQQQEFVPSLPML